MKSNTIIKIILCTVVLLFITKNTPRTMPPTHERERAATLVMQTVEEIWTSILATQPDNFRNTRLALARHIEQIPRRLHPLVKRQLINHIKPRIDILFFNFPVVRVAARTATPGTSGNITSTDFSPDGTLFAYTDNRGLRIIDLSSLTIVHDITLQNAMQATFSASESMIMVRAGDTTNIYRFDQQQMLHVANIFMPNTNQAKLDPLMEYVLIEHGIHSFFLQNINNSRIARNFPEAFAERAYFTHNGNLLFVTDDALLIWDRNALPHGIVPSLQFAIPTITIDQGTPQETVFDSQVLDIKSTVVNGEEIVAVIYYAYGTDVSQLYIYNLTRNTTTPVALPTIDPQIMELAPASNFLAIGFTNGRVILVDLVNNYRIAEVQSADNRVIGALTFDTSGTLLALSLHPNNVALWEITRTTPGDTQIYEYVHDASLGGFVTKMARSHYGSFIASSTAIKLSLFLIPGRVDQWNINQALFLNMLYLVVTEIERSEDPNSPRQILKNNMLDQQDIINSFQPDWLREIVRAMVNAL